MDEIQKGMVDTGTLSSKDSCASARAGHAPVIQEIDKCASVLDEESRAYLQYVVTVPRTEDSSVREKSRREDRTVATHLAGKIKTPRFSKYGL